MAYDEDERTMTTEFNEQHPVSTAMQTVILERLAALEALHDVTILLAVESGSRGWGFASPDSDYDVRFIYVHPQDWYLTISPGRDVLEVPISQDLDISGWDLRKTLTLLANGNVTPVEWLNSPIRYRTESHFADGLRDVMAFTHRSDRAFRHYVSIASNQPYSVSETTVHLKRFLYALRSTLAARWVQQFDSAAPMRLVPLADAIVTDAKVRSAIDEVVELKRSAGESKTAEVPARLRRFVERELQELSEVNFERTSPVDESPLNEFFRQTTRSVTDSPRQDTRAMRNNAS